MPSTLGSPFHVKAAWALPLAEGYENKLLLVDGNHAVSEDCTVLFKSHSNAIHRINLICSTNMTEDKKETKSITNCRGEEENELLFKEITEWMDRCPSLTVLKVKGFPLSKGMVENLAEALKTSKTLQHLSLEKNALGDEGCFRLCSALTSSPTVSSISLLGNDLTKKSASAIAALLERQEMARGLVWWKRSLRNRQVEAESLLGLNRISLNNNPGITDDGLHLIVDSLYDDFWIKAVDMQDCGITNKGAEEVVKLLKVNKELHVFDLRNNEDVSLHLLGSIMYRISQNLGPNISEAKWLHSETSCESSVCEKPLAAKTKQRPQTSNYSGLKRKDFRSKSIELIKSELSRSIISRKPSKKRVSTAFC